MLKALKHWFSKNDSDADWRTIAAWARQQGFDFKRVRDEPGFVIDGTFDGQPWRLEWGPPQRNYITGRELRLRMELGLPSGLQMLVLSRRLMEKLERETFERFTESMQTQVDHSMPEEMRWLAMFSKVNLSSMKGLRSGFGAVASTPAPALGWLEGPLSVQLQDASTNLLDDGSPLVLMTLRGRLYMRLQLDVPDVPRLACAVALYETAARQALHLVNGEPHESGTWPSTASTAWQSQFAASEPPSGKR